MYARMHNIGRGGMYFETDTFLNKGEKLRIEFFKPLSFTRRRIFPSTVKWCKGLADDEGKTYGYGLGVKFG